MNFKFILSILVAVVFIFLIHETPHWLAGTILQYPMVVTLNTTYPANGFYTRPWHYPLVSAEGPLTTLLQSLAGFLLMEGLGPVQLSFDGRPSAPVSYSVEPDGKHL